MLVLLLEAVLFLLEPAFLFARLVFELLDLASEFVALAEDFLLGLQLRFPDEVLGIPLGLFNQLSRPRIGTIQIQAILAAQEKVTGHAAGTQPQKERCAGE